MCKRAVRTGTFFRNFCSPYSALKLLHAFFLTATVACTLLLREQFVL